MNSLTKIMLWSLAISIPATVMGFVLGGVFMDSDSLLAASIVYMFLWPYFLLSYAEANYISGQLTEGLRYLYLWIALLQFLGYFLAVFLVRHVYKILRLRNAEA